MDHSSHARSPGASAPTPFGGAGDYAPMPFSAWADPMKPSYDRGHDGERYKLATYQWVLTTILFANAANWWKQSRQITDKLVVEIVGTHQHGKGRAEGKHEGKLAVVLSVLDLSNAELSCAVVQELPERQVEHHVPAQYLKPHTPDKGDEAIVIAGE